MMNLGLTAADHRIYLDTCAGKYGGYELRTTVQLLTPTHQVVRTVTEVLLDGQVDVTAPAWNDGEIEISRGAQLQFLDPDKTLALDSGTPSNGAYYMDRMVRVTCSVLCPFGVGWVHAPVFTGPIVKVDRDIDVVNVECEGKERYALGAAWVAGGPFSGKRNAVITSLLRKTGEQTKYMDLPDTKLTVGKKFSVGKESTYWSHVWRIGSSMNRHVFYDGRGVFVTRPRSSKTTLVAHDREDGFLLDLQVSNSTENVKNAVEVTGAKKSKGKRSPYARAAAPKGHPLAFERDGARLYLADFISNPDLKTTAACRRFAVDELEDNLRQAVDVTAKLKPIYTLEPWDLVLLDGAKATTTVRANAFTLPVVQKSGDGTPMTLGSTINVLRPQRIIGRV